jgi:hypothetical protein
MRHRAHIDRTKHEVDITERVLNGGVWALPSSDHGQVVDVELKIDVWPLGTTESAVQVRRGSDNED